MKKKGIIYTAAALLLLVIFSVGVWVFVKEVNDQLWIGSIRTIIESSHQGANALNMQFEMEFQELETIWDTIADTDAEKAEEALNLYHVVDSDIMLYFYGEENQHLNEKKDEMVSYFLAENFRERGLLDSHTSSITGENVFNLFVRGTFADGTLAYLVKEFRTKEIAEQFTLSFYNNAGFSYLVSREGTIMVRPSHRNSNKTVFNIFDIISEEKNDPQMIKSFQDNVYALKNGWAKFIYNGTSMVFCYEALRKDADWLLISIVPEQRITEQASRILQKTLIFSGMAVVIILILVLSFYGIKMHENKVHTEELQKALNTADMANKAKGRFLMNMSHDIRTPLNAIIGMTVIAQENIDDIVKTENCLKEIKSAGTHLLSLVNDVMDMSQIDQGKLILKEEALVLSQIFEESASLMQRRAQAANLTLEVSPARLENSVMIGDPFRIRQVMLNIISNAIKYTPSGGHVLLELTQQGVNADGYGIYHFRCTDTGIGIEPEVIERIFQPFERAKNTTASKIPGTGVGLAITKSLLNLMDSDISVESTLGQGSVFTVEFRLNILDDAADEQQNIPCPAQTGFVLPEDASTDVHNRAQDRQAEPGETKTAGELTTNEAGTGGEQAEKPAAEDTKEADTKENEKIISYENKHILLVEDNELNMEILEEMLSILGAPCEKAADGQEAVQMVQEKPCGYYDLIFMDIQMPIMDGFEATRQIRAMGRNDSRTIPIYAVSANALAEDVRNAAEAGMNGHIPKPVDLGAIDRVLRSL